LTAVLQRRRGGGRGQPARLNAAQGQELIAAAASAGRFSSITDACRWVRERFGQEYTDCGMRSLVRRLRMRKKVPRPQAEKASAPAQVAWKQGGWQPLGATLVYMPGSGSSTATSCAWGWSASFGGAGRRGG
jgi:transposase